MARKPRPPAGLAAAGKAFWASTVSAFELSEAELSVLAIACRTLDTTSDLEGLVAADGLMIEGSRGQRVLHPAVAELRQQRSTFARLLVQLGLPDEQDETVPSQRSVRASRAAQARWGKRNELAERRRRQASGA